MSSSNFLPLGLGLIIFVFIITSILIVPFIDLLYKLRLIRKKEGAKNGKKSLYAKLHDIKAGTPVGGGILVIAVVTIIFLLTFPLSRHMGIKINSSFDLSTELFLILFVFLSFGFLGLTDDIIKIFGKPKTGDRPIGLTFGLTRRSKFLLQWVLGFVVGFVLYKNLGIHILHIPMVDKIIDLGFWYVPFAAFVIVGFSNAFNITDGLDGLASGLLVICLIAFGSIAATALDVPLSLFISIWVGALIAFLYFNTWPARIFLGDAGALSFGAMLGLIGLLTGSIVALLVIGGLFVADAASSLIQIFGWKVIKRPIFPIAPFHHTLLAKGWEEPKIVTRAWLAGLILAIFGLWLANI